MYKTRLDWKSGKELLQLGSKSYTLFEFSGLFVTHQPAEISIVTRVCGIRIILSQQIIEPMFWIFPLGLRDIYSNVTQTRRSNCYLQSCDCLAAFAQTRETRFDQIGSRQGSIHMFQFTAEPRDYSRLVWWRPLASAKVSAPARLEVVDRPP